MLIEGSRSNFSNMPALLIESFPEDLHDKLRRIATVHRRTVTQETIHLLESAIHASETSLQSNGTGSQPRWAKRKLLPHYESLLKSGALSSSDDSTLGLSEERDAR